MNPKWFLNNWVLKVIALLLAVITWFYVKGSKF